MKKEKKMNLVERFLVALLSLMGGVGSTFAAIVLGNVVFDAFLASVGNPAIL